MRKKLLLSAIAYVLAFSLTGCRYETNQINAESNETVSEEEQEINLTELLSAINNSVTKHCGTEYTLTPFAQYKLPDGTLTDDLSEVCKESLEDNRLTAYILFNLPQNGDKFEDMAAQHYIEAVIDVSSYEVLSLSESDSSIESRNWTKIF